MVLIKKKVFRSCIITLYFVGEYGTVAGWGRLSEKGVLPSILQNVTFISNKMIYIIRKLSAKFYLASFKMLFKMGLTFNQILHI